MKEKVSQSLHLIVSVVVAGVVLFGLWTLHTDHQKIDAVVALIQQNAQRSQQAQSQPVTAK